MEKFKEPSSMDECLYFTNRTSETGRIKAWVFRPVCQKCKKGVMGKPVVKGKKKIRAAEYVCNNCGFEISKDELEPTLEMCVDYKCPYCAFKGQTTTFYKRKKFEGVDAYVFECEKCKQKIGITKKMKATKKEKSKGAEDDVPDDDE